MLAGAACMRAGRWCQRRLAVSRLLQDLTGLSIKRLVRTLRPLRSVTINLAGTHITADPVLTEETEKLLNRLSWCRGD